jgi:hypothetical protein
MSFQALLLQILTNNSTMIAYHCLRLLLAGVIIKVCYLRLAIGSQHVGKFSYSRSIAHWADHRYSCNHPNLLWWAGYGSVCQTTESNPYLYGCTNAHSHYATHYDRNALSDIYRFPDIGRSDRYADSIRHKAANQHALANGIANRNGNTNGHTNIHSNSECHTFGDIAAFEHTNSFSNANTELYADDNTLSNSNMDSDSYAYSIPDDYHNPAPNRNPLMD